MWWGGSEGDQGGSPPPDPPIAQGDTSQGGEDPAVVRQELGDLKEQFDEQQALIGQLKTMLKKKEETLSGREKEVQDYATRLAKMKPRLGRRVKPKQSSSSSDRAESGERSETADASASEMEKTTGDGAEALPPSSSLGESHPSTSSVEEDRLKPPLPEGDLTLERQGIVEEKKLSSSESSSRAKILLLRKQLQENRLKFQRQQKDDEKLAMEEMKQRIERLRTEVEHRDDIIQSLHEGKGSAQEEPSMQKLYQQIVYKDNTIMELSQKVNHLEQLIQGHQESLSEKDKIIEARTEAVSLIAKAQDEKHAKTLDELEEVRFQMKKMQEDFVSREQELNTKNETLNKELSDKIKKINQLEDNGKRLENLRFEMSARNAELQEKIVGLQSDAKTLREQSEAERETFVEKEALLQDLKQKLNRAESHGQKKLKALEKQLRSIKQDGNAGEKIVELQNSIAELEEEKGNLQLKLVDFDDLKVTNERLSATRSKLEDQIKRLNCDLDSQLSAITQLETEKIKLVEGINERENRIYDLESEMSSLKTNLEEITQAKVTLDLRLCEVEEQRDTAEASRAELENQMTETGRAPVEKLLVEKGSLEESLQSIMKEREEWEQKYSGQIQTVEECEKKAKLAEEIKDQKARECKRLMNILTDKENAIATFSIQIDKNDAVVSGYEAKLTAANAACEKLTLELNTVSQNLEDRLHAAHNAIAEMEDRLERSERELRSKETELRAMEGDIESLNRSLNEKNITVQNLVGEVSGLQEEVNQKEKSLDGHIDRLEDLESQISHQDKEIEKLCSTIAERDSQISTNKTEIEKLMRDLSESSKTLESTKTSLNCELDAVSAMLNGAKNQYESAKMNIEMKDREIENNQVIISKYEQEVCDKNRTLDETENRRQELQARLSSVSSSLEKQEATIIQLQNEVEYKILCVENLQRQQSSLEQKVLHQAEENKFIADEKCRLDEELADALSTVKSLENTISEKVEKVAHLEASVGSLTSEIQNKTSEMEKWQQEALEKSEQLNTLIQQFENVQSDSGSKDTLVSDLQVQNTQQQQHISELSQQLQDAQVLSNESQQNLSQVQEQLSFAQQQLTQAQEYSNRLQEELDVSKTQLQDTNIQYEKVTALATQFEEQLRVRSASLEDAEKQMSSQGESNSQQLMMAQRDVEHWSSEASRLEIEVKTHKDQSETTQAELSQYQELLRNAQEELVSMRSSQESSHQQLGMTKQELESKCQEVLQVQQSLSEYQQKANSLQEELTQVMSYQQQYQQQIHSLQGELQQAVNLKQQNESEIAALSVTQQQRISQLEGELLSLNQVRDHLQAECEKNNVELQNQLHIVNELKTHIENLTTQAGSKDVEIQTLQVKISDFVKSEEELKTSLAKLQEEKTQWTARQTELEEQIQKTRSISDSLDQGSRSMTEVSSSEVNSLKEELAKALDQSKFLEEECDGLRVDANDLKNQLQEARQTITHLQTSLATQPQSAPSADTWDDWGEVDLGAPVATPTEPPHQASSLVSSLQKSLADKDEMLTMMQDQLKETLQEINTITEEKKILELQRKSMEANASQDVNKLKEEVERLKRELESSSSNQDTMREEKERMALLEQELSQKQSIIEGLNQQLLQLGSRAAEVTEETVVSSQAQEVHQTPPQGANLFGTTEWPQTSSNQDAASWFDQPLGVQENPITGANLDKQEDPASWFDQTHVSTEPQLVGSNIQSSQSYEQQSQQQQPPQQQQQQNYEQPQQQEQPPLPQGQESVNVEELQYKLSWYEEQWSTWTSHYNVLQTSYQESEQKVAELSHQIQELQSHSSEAKDEVTSPTEGGETIDIGKSTSQAQELLDKLAVAQKELEQLREENQLLQVNANQVVELKSQLQAVQETTQDPSLLRNAEAEINHLRGFETQVYELQSQVQALQHQCTAMQNKLSESELEVTRLREVEALYGELQSCIQESETKREGSTSRVQELELMVQSAESEIARLRNQIEVFNQVTQTGEGLQESVHNQEILRLQTELETCQNESHLFKNEVEKYHNESEFYKAEIARLENENQNMGDEMERARSDLQRMERENSQLRSECEVFEGELDRLRSAYELYESENNRLRGDYEALSQANQMTEAEKESLESEVQRITAQNMTLSTDTEHLRDEIQRLTQVSTSAETEIGRLQREMERFQSLDLQYNDLESKYNELQAQLASIDLTQGSKMSESEPQSLIVEEVDWGAEAKIEDEHRQRSSSVDLKYQEEIDDLKAKVIAMEKEKNGLYEELQTAKLKSGKMLQKLKAAQSKNETLTKEIQKLKAKAGGFSDLDQALEEEWKAQVAKAETDRDEFKQKLDEVENEKDHLLTQVDVLTAAQEQYIEMKEDQDTTIKLLKARNKEVEGQIQALEWKISELEEAVEQQQTLSDDAQRHIIEPSPSPEREAATLETAPVSSTATKVSDRELEDLKSQMSSLHQEIKILKSENDRLRTSSKDLEEAVESLSRENETFQSVIEGLKEAKAKTEKESSDYKQLYIELHTEHESMVKEKDKTNEELQKLTYTHETLKAAYNSLYAEFNDLRDVCDSHKHDIGILKGERDRLLEEINSLTNQLEALHEEEEEETIRALQDECFSLREQTSLLHEENTALEVKTEDAVEKASRLESTLEQNVEMQKLLQEEIMKKTEEISFYTSSIEGLERQMTYSNAEMAALKTKLTQQDQAEESTLETTQRLEAQIEQLQDQNHQLRIQVEAAESSLTKLAGGSGENSEAPSVPAAPSAQELEAALASLHLRDLRCQQLSLEITKLLEERDALQLKLSASLRQTQELSRELSLSHQLPAPVAPEPSLDQKLAELRELNDSLEQKALISLQGAVSNRRIAIGGLQSPPIFTPHTAPPTPTATRHADYTLTREAQGTSSTLIDWIMGKSTPRVMHV